MVGVGKKIKVSLKNNNASGGISLDDRISIRPGTTMTVGGTIIEEYDPTHWLVELEIEVDGKNRIVVPKSSEV